MNKPIVAALVGHPNCGKTTLFNALTGSHQRVGNFAGVTVECSAASIFPLSRITATNSQVSQASQAVDIELVDLPGCYTLSPAQSSSIDEKITQDYLASDGVSLIINVINASQLERHLPLTLKLLKQNKPMIVVLTMIEEARKLNLEIDAKALSEELNCPVIPICFSKKIPSKNSLEALITALLQISNVSESDDQQCNHQKNNIDNLNCLQHIIKKSCSHKINTNAISEKIDHIVLNKWLGLPLFFVIMYLVFVFVVGGGGFIQDHLETALEFFCLELPTQWLFYLNAPEWSIKILAGVFQGISTTVSFIPVIGAMFLCLSLLEASGYMARAAFVMDKIMQMVGLSGKAFIPMILGFGCNVPAILGTRTLENPAERIRTIMMSPFMSCGARLAIYALFVAAFFKDNGANIVFILYLVGVLMAFITGLLLKNIMKQEPLFLVLELPPYRVPHFNTILKITWGRLKRFILKAGVIIIPLCMLLNAVSVIKLENNESVLTQIGRSVTPVFSPMGIQQDNWPAVVGLLTGILAKEVVVGTLNSLYHQKTDIDNPHIYNKATNRDDRQNSLIQEQKEQKMMAAYFGNELSVFAYLLFVLLYFPCVSVLATIARELNASWAAFSMTFTTTLAYIVSTLFYQIATFSEHPHYSFIWISLIGACLPIGLWGIRKWVLLEMERGKNQIQAKKTQNNINKRLPTQILIR